MVKNMSMNLFCEYEACERDDFQALVIYLFEAHSGFVTCYFDKIHTVSHKQNLMEKIRSPSQNVKDTPQRSLLLRPLADWDNEEMQKLIKQMGWNA